jgi:uncharacterized protein with PIN domain
MATVRFRFYEELNDFLPPQRRGCEFSWRGAAAARVRHAIETLGVPHTEVELVLVNGESVGFERRLHDGDRVSVYPKFETFDVTPLVRVRESPLRITRFVADAHLGALARQLRMIGFDTLYQNCFSDDEVERLAREQQRIVRTRDRALLKRRGITHGCYVRALQPQWQLREVFDRLDLARAARPFTRCLSCNGMLRPVEPQRVDALVPAGVRQRYRRFCLCDGCARVFWEGTHWRRMRDLVDALTAAPVEEHA